ncbi:MAG: hypothetical protein AAB224_06975, partial [Gemmatimonadota bacterium]
MAALIVAASVLSGCHHGAADPSLNARLSEPRCPPPPEGIGRIEVTQSTAPDVRFVGSDSGALLIHSTVSSRGQTRAVPSAMVDVFQGTLQHPSVLYSALADDLGWSRTDPLAAGVYEVRVRQFGYEILRLQIGIRAGFVDSVHAQMRTQAICLTELVSVLKRRFSMVSCGSQ